MTNFDEYVDESIDHVAKIREKLRARFGAIDRDLELILVKAAVEPWGIVKKSPDQKQAAGESGKQVTADNSIVEIMAKWDLVDDNGKLKPRKFLKEGFADLAKELEQHGYKYNKNAGGFLPAWKGVKP